MLVDISTPRPKMVLFYINGKHHFPLISPIVKANTDIDFFIHSQSVTEDDYRRSELFRQENAHFVAASPRLQCKLNLFGAYISTDMHAVGAHTYSLRIAKKFNRLGVPVFELQHEMFQVGLHYYDKPSRELFWDDSLPTRTFASRVFAYYPVADGIAPHTVIGYPPFKSPITAHRTGEYILVLSNMHWSTYTHDERCDFYKAVFDYARNHPNEHFIWDVHSGEVENPECKALITGMFDMFPPLAKQIVFTHEQEVLPFLPISELVANSKCVISTPSTALLDCEMYSRRVAVYRCATNRTLTSRIRSATFFGNSEELEHCMSIGPVPIKSGLLFPYDNKAFRKILDESYHETDKDQAEWLDILLAEQPQK